LNQGDPNLRSGRIIWNRIVHNMIVVRICTRRPVNEDVEFFVAPEHILIGLETATSIVYPQARQRKGIALTTD
jgi:hypothetical protein